MTHHWRSSQCCRARHLLLGTIRARNPRVAVLRRHDCRDLFVSSRSRSVRCHRRWFRYGRFHTRGWAVRLLRRALSDRPLVIGLLFAVPAARAGYDVTLALANLGIPEEWWRKSFAVLGASLSGAPPGRMCRCGPTPLSDRALRSALFSHRMGRRPRAGDYARLSSLGWHDADIWSSLLIATSRSSRSLRLSRVISSADCSPVVTGMRWLLSAR